jgi:methionine--tRNA ligase beta chain
MISFEDFQKIDLRVAKVIEAENVKDSEKLLKLKIDLGGEIRQIVAGIAKFYKPADLIGKEIIVVVNLEPKVLFGLESQGMLLAAEDNERVSLLIPDQEVPPGTKIH